MGPVTAIAIYLIIWWMTLFAVLPVFGRRADEAAPQDGADAGAPAAFDLRRAVLITTGVSIVLFAIAYGLILSGVLGGEGPAWRFDGAVSLPSAPRAV